MATQPESPRKASSSSAEPKDRPRYIGVEIGGGERVGPRDLSRLLAQLLPSRDTPGGPETPRLRVIRMEGSRAIVEVPHWASAPARTLWNRDPLPGLNGRVRTVRTWGTLRKAKRWMGVRRPRRGAPESPSGRSGPARKGSPPPFDTF